ncbi:drug/metabolite transporter (DMT) family permease [Leptospira ryugenii]|uniref:Drug/metabolite transporter (DMT) family permease n=1 Tax=Leptospira ryugenii TaxID=1917863 RepID=A0A2P2E2P9_9LEPT|nr:DMT family transporter [Leptospira ryugenii]GBF51139.1 drug/metabolite transporter (DMT) family permease [Leptospira ryugenii]
MRLRFYFLLVLAMLSWGISWPLAKMISVSVPIHVLVFWRFLCTWLSVIPLLLVLRIPIILPSGRDYFNVLIGGIIYTLYNQFFFLGLAKGLPGAGGVLVTTLNPILTFFLVSLVFRKGILKSQAIGLFVGLIGGLTILKVWEVNFADLVQSGNLFFLFASLTWAFLSLNSQKTGSRIHTLSYSFFVYAIGSVLEFLFSFREPSFLHVFQQNATFWWIIAYLSVISTTFGTTVYFFASTKLGSATASSFIFIVPLSAYLSSFFILEEKIQSHVFIGGSLAVIAVYLINHTNKVSD